MADTALNVPPIERRHRMRIAMEWADLKPGDMARELDVARTTVTNYLVGRTQPPRSVITAWAMRTGVSRNWLEHGVVPDDPSSTEWYCDDLMTMLEAA